MCVATDTGKAEKSDHLELRITCYMLVIKIVVLLLEVKVH